MFSSGARASLSITIGQFKYKSRRVAKSPSIELSVTRVDIERKCDCDKSPVDHQRANARSNSRSSNSQRPVTREPCRNNCHITVKEKVRKGWVFDEFAPEVATNL